MILIWEVKIIKSYERKLNNPLYLKGSTFDIFTIALVTLALVSLVINRGRNYLAFLSDYNISDEGF